MHSTHAPNLHLPLESSSALLSSTERAMIAATDAVHAVHPRPADHSMVSWPDDPALNITTSALISPRNGNEEPGQPGQFIYYMPLGHKGGKGENPRAWTHGWGDRFNTFWCCYGTAVESFSKLADSIYFWYEHPSPSTLNSTQEEGGDVYPILFVNQFVSSTLRWSLPAASAGDDKEEEEEERVVVLKQTADLYSNNVATSRVVITISSSPSSSDNRTNDEASSSSSSSSSANFYLYWRLPSWLNNEDGGDDSTLSAINKKEKKKLAIRINGKALDTNALPRLHKKHAKTVPNKEKEEKLSSSFSRSSLLPSSLPLQLPLLSSSFNPPTFGKDASDYIVIGREWKDGDVLEVDMPMKITTEDLNDYRSEKQNLKAVMMGPFQMAGLTENGDREIDIEPEDIENAVTLLENEKNYDDNSSGGGGGSGAVERNLYPKGARLLSGKTKKYVIAPIGQLIDEKYTAYFDFISVGPSEAVASQ
jgi:Beta-L-arabinofuranosidase, GH127